MYHRFFAIGDGAKSVENLSKARANLHNALLAEEIHWKQKSRIKWLEAGNRKYQVLPYCCQDQKLLQVNRQHSAQWFRIWESKSDWSVVSWSFFQMLLTIARCYWSEALYLLIKMMIYVPFLLLMKSGKLWSLWRMIVLLIQIDIQVFSTSIVGKLSVLLWLMRFKKKIGWG